MEIAIITIIIILIAACSMLLGMLFSTMLEKLTKH